MKISAHGADLQGGGWGCRSAPMHGQLEIVYFEAVTSNSMGGLLAFSLRAWGTSACSTVSNIVRYCTFTDPSCVQTPGVHEQQVCIQNSVCIQHQNQLMIVLVLVLHTTTNHLGYRPNVGGQVLQKKSSSHPCNQSMHATRLAVNLQVLMF